MEHTPWHQQYSTQSAILSALIFPATSSYTPAGQTFTHLRYNYITCINIDSPGAAGVTTYGPLYMSESVDLQRESIREVTGLEIERTLWPGRDGDSSFWGTGLSNIGLFSEQPEAEADPFVNYAGLGWWWHTPFATLDRGDPEILARDIKANVNFIFKLGNCPVLPMNFVSYAGELIKILEELQEKVDKVRAYFNLSSVIDHAKEFKRDAESLESLIQKTITEFESANDQNAFTPIFEELNQCLMWVCRHINIIAHSNASKAEQMFMESFGLKPFPRLQPILDLIQLQLPHTPEFKRLITKLVRQRNFVEDGFYLASKQIRDTISKVNAALL